MRRWPTSMVLLVVLCTPLAAEEPSADQARAAAGSFGEALRQGDASGMRSILPSQGKVQLNLARLGPEQGSFSARQVEALFADFLSQGSVGSFEVAGVEHDPGRFALVHARIKLVDRHGRPAKVELHLAFQPEDGRWVLREVRETR